MLVYVLNRNRLTTTRKLVDQLLGFAGAEVSIFDIESTWPPLLEWYEGECPVEVHRYEANLGPRRIWQVDGMIPENDCYAVTDSDLDLEGCPPDTLAVLQRGLAAHRDVTKVGVSLRLDDIPKEYPIGEAVREWEGKYWETERGEGFYVAEIATTLAVYRPGTIVNWYGPALRSKPPYTARHVPWYLTSETITDEERYVIEYSNSDQSSNRYLHWSRRIFRHLEELENAPS